MVVARRIRSRSARARSASDQQGTLLSDFAGRPIASPKTTPTTTEVLKAKRSLLRRAKTSERDFAKWLKDHDGADPRYRHLTTSTGRIGHLSGLQADSVSIHYLAECKNVKTPATLAKWWQQICTKAVEWGKDPILMWEPSNGSLYKVNGKRLPNMHIITEDRHAELLAKEQAFDAYGTGS